MPNEFFCVFLHFIYIYAMNTKIMNNKVIVLLAVLMLGFAAAAQGSFTLTTGAESRNMDAEMLSEAKYLGQYEGLHCWAGGKEGEQKVVMLTDHNMMPMSSMVLPESSEGCKIMTATMDDGKACLTLVDSSYAKMTFIYSSVIELATMRPADSTAPMVLVDSLGYGRNDHCYAWGAVSPNGRLAAIIYIVEYTDRQQYSARAILYDAQLREQWRKDYALGSMENLVVTDDGTMVTTGFEEGGDETHFIYNILERNRAETFDAVVQCPHVRQLKLAGVAGSKVIGVGTFSPAEGRYQEMLCEGVLTMAFDINSASLTGFNMRTFQNEDLNILLNAKTRRVQKYQDIDLVSVSGYTITDWGAVVAVGRNWHLNRTEDNGTTSLLYHRMGLHLVAIDTTGRVRWVRNLRRNDVQRNDNYLLGLQMTSHEGVTYIVKNEPRRTPPIYEIGREAKLLAMGDRSVLALYTISADGEVEKHILSAKTPYSLLQAIQRPDGHLLLGAAGKKVKLGEVKCER